MSASLLLAFAIVILGIAYRWHGTYLTRKLQINPVHPTPAHKMGDGVDYVPAKRIVLIGHHFASIAGAGPILGPVYAAVFGWAPVYAWIILGVIFIGGVHDFTSLVASIRHQGKSIGEVIEEYIGKSGKILFLIFTWFMLILVIAVFAKAVASTFVKTPASASSSIFFIFLALLFGFSLYKWKVPLVWASVAGVILLWVGIFLGNAWPLSLGYNVWLFILFGYVFVASVTPVWILLQPRDYLNSYLLYFVMLGGLIGIFVTNPTIAMPAMTTFHTDLGMLFPILFVTVACGAVSGFHSLVASGTTAKQLNTETDAKPVGYGSMLIEGILAVVALITAVTLTQGHYQDMITKTGGGPISIFASGIGTFMSTLGIPIHAGVTFAALAISAFALTSLDTATRLARFSFQELFSDGKLAVLGKNRYLATTITVIVAGLLTFSGKSSTIWPLFGAANQLLAAMALLAVTVWLAKLGTKNNFVKIPMVFMLLVTLIALITLVYQNWAKGNFILSILGAVLLAVAIILVWQARKSLVAKIS